MVEKNWAFLASNSLKSLVFRKWQLFKKFYNFKKQFFETEEWANFSRITQYYFLIFNTLCSEFQQTGTNVKSTSDKYMWCVVQFGAKRLKTAFKWLTKTSF